jgi:hypothetical protein
MLSDPLSVTYGGASKSLPRVTMGEGYTSYRTSDREFEIKISHSQTAAGNKRHSIKLSRIMPDPTPLDVFDAYREVVNSCEFTWEVDANGKDSSAVAECQNALSSLVDSSFRTRLLGGEG